MTNFHKVFHLAGLTAAAAIVIAATQDVSAKQYGASCASSATVVGLACR